MQLIINRWRTPDKTVGGGGGDNLQDTMQCSLLARTQYDGAIVISYVRALYAQYSNGLDSQLTGIADGFLRVIRKQQQ